MGLTLVNLVLATVLLIGGIMALKLAPGHALLVAAFVVAIVFVIVQAVVAVLTQIDMAAVIADIMPGMMQAAGTKAGAGGDQAAVMAMAAKVGMYVGLAFSLVLALAKLIFYAVGTLYSAVRTSASCLKPRRPGTPGRTLAERDRSRISCVVTLVYGRCRRSRS